MSAGQRLGLPPLSATERDPIAVRLAALEAEVAALRATNAELREQLSLRDLALDSASSFFVIARLTEGEPIMVYCNRAVAEQHGCAREELIGRTMESMHQWSRRDPQHRAKVNAALRAGKPYLYENEVQRPDGSSYWVGISIQPVLDAEGRLTHSVTIGADITAKREEALKKRELQEKLLAEMHERERVVMELQLAQKLESVGRLAAGVAHEINTPIQYVGDSVLFLRNAYEDFHRLGEELSRALGELPEGPLRTALEQRIAQLAERYDARYLLTEIPRAFERTLDGVTRVSNIVKAMKEFAHPPSNEQSAADINHALETTLLIASNEYKYLARVHTEFAELPGVICNIGELNQVFLNLIVNAAHAIQDAGKDVVSGEIHVCTALADESVVIRIRDNGCGIPAEHLSKIYDPFFTTKEVGRGSGQGLAIARSILVDQHGGSIDVRSELGVGTEFTLKLPIAGRASTNL